MQLIDCFGSNYQTRCNLSFTSTEAQLDIQGEYYFRELKGYELLYDAMRTNPCETIKNIAEYIDGAYVFVFINPPGHVAWVTTDPYSLKRIYYRDASGRALVTDTISDFFNVGNEKVIWDYKGLQEYLRFLDMSSPRSCFSDIHVLGSGKVLKISDNNNNAEIYEKQQPKIFPVDISFADAVTEVNNVLTSVTKKRLDQCGRIGLLLSGGVDSSLLAATLAKLGCRENPEKLIAYTVGFSEPELDESPIAVSVAWHLGLEHKVLKFSVEDEYRAFFELCSLMEIPFADPATISTYLALQTMQRDGVTDVMEGTGADGVIGMVLPKYYKRLLKIDTYVPPFLRHIIHRMLQLTGDPAGYSPYFDFDEVEEKFIRWKGWTRREVERLSGRSCDFSESAFYIDFQKKRYANDTELSRIFMLPPDYRITETTYLMGLKQVFPFHDREFKALILSLPDDYKHRDNEPKGLYRAVLETMVPRPVWDVVKHGFDYPFERLLLYRNAALIERYLSHEALGWHNLFDIDMAVEYRDRFLHGDMSLRFKLWALVVFQGWYENNHNWFLKEGNGRKIAIA